MPKENTTIYIILGLLNHEDLSGYDIKKRIDNQIRHFWEVGYGQIYPTLAKLETEGLVTRRVSEISGGPEKNLYSITDKGRDVLKNWLLTSEEKEYTKYEILLKLFFGSLATLEDNTNRIETFKSRQIEKLEMMKLYKENLGRVLDKDEDHIFYYLTVMFGEKIYRAYIEWADEAVRLLENKFGNR